MKKNISLIGLISILLIVGLSVIGCGKGGGSPSNVVKQLHVAIDKQDAKAIGRLATPEAAEMINMFGEKGKGMLAEKGGIVKTEEIINGDTAIVTVTYKNDETDDYELVKIDGKWKISLDK